MSIGSEAALRAPLPIGQVLSDLRRSGQASAVARSVVLVVVTLAVFWPALRYTYEGMRIGMDPTGPLAFVPFVPLAALAVAATRWSGTPAEPLPLPQRSADWTIAGFLLLTSWVLAVNVPFVFTTQTLTWRADLLPVAPFVGALVTILFGSRMLFRLRAPLVLLTAMSPALYRAVLEPVRALTDRATGALLPVMDAPLPFVHATLASDGSRYVTVDGPDGPFTVMVAQVCAGGGAVLAGALLAATVWLVTTGSVPRKLAWLATTLLLCWLGNAVRLTALFVAGHLTGVESATGGLHLWAGAATLALALTASLALTRRFGLRMRPRDRHPQPLATLPRLTPPAGGTLAVLAIVVAVPAATATSSYDFFAGASRTPAAAAAPTVAAAPGATALQPVSWAATFFGSDAEWERWLLFPAPDQQPVSVDVVTTRQVSTFDEYGLAACYGYHGYRIEESTTTPLPGDRLGEEIVYVDPSNGDRVRVLSWRQRVHGDRYERVVLQHRTAYDEPARPQVLHVAAERLLTEGARRA